MYKGIVCVLLAAIMWGTGGVAGQFLYTYQGTDPVWLVMVRQLVAGTLFLAYSKLVLKEKLLALLREFPVSILIFSFPGILGAQLGYYYTISLCNAATATVLQYTAPIFVVLWMSYAEGRKPSGREMLGVVLAFAGVFLIASHGRMDSLAISGVALVTGLLSALAYALYSIQPRAMLERYATTTVIGWGQLLAGLFLICFRNPFEASGSWNLVEVLVFAHLIIGATVFTYALYLTGLKLIGPTRAALLSCAEPLSSIVCMVLLLGTELTLPDLVGMGCIIFTVAMLSLQEK